MDRKYKVGGYVKLAKLWERSKDAAVAYHSSYYAEKFRDDADKRLVGVYIDITGNKEIYKRPEMVHLLKDCKKGAVNLIFSQTRAYLAANTWARSQRIMGIAALPMFRNTMKQSFRRKLHGLHIWWHPAGRSAVCRILW